MDMGSERMTSLLSAFILLQIFTDLTHTQWLEECPANWLEFNSHCYFFDYNTSVNWSEARNQCGLDVAGADLVVMETEGELTFINDIIGPPFPLSYLWIGLSGNYDSDGRYYWVTGVELLDNLSYWEFGQPNNYFGMEHCVDLLAGDYKAHGVWRDIWCGTQQGYICEKKREPLVTISFAPRTKKSNHVENTSIAPSFSGITSMALLYSESTFMSTRFSENTSMSPHRSDSSSVAPRNYSESISMVPRFRSDIVSMAPPIGESTSVKKSPIYIESTYVAPHYSSDITSLVPSYIESAPVEPSYIQRTSVAQSNMTSVAPRYSNERTSMAPSYRSDSTSMAPGYNEITSVTPRNTERTSGAPRYTESTSMPPSNGESTSMAPHKIESTAMTPHHSESTSLTPSYSESTSMNPCSSDSTFMAPRFSDITPVVPNIESTSVPLNNGKTTSMSPRYSGQTSIAPSYIESTLLTSHYRESTSMAPGTSDITLMSQHHGDSTLVGPSYSKSIPMSSHDGEATLMSFHTRINDNGESIQITSHTMILSHTDSNSLVPLTTEFIHGENTVRALHTTLFSRHNTHPQSTWSKQSTLHSPFIQNSVSHHQPDEMSSITHLSSIFVFLTSDISSFLIAPSSQRSSGKASDVIETPSIPPLPPTITQERSRLTSIQTIFTQNTRTLTEHESIGKNGAQQTCLYTEDATTIQDSNIYDTNEYNSILLSYVEGDLLVTVTDQHTSIATSIDALISHSTPWTTNSFGTDTLEMFKTPQDILISGTSLNSISEILPTSRKMSCEQSTQNIVRTLVDLSVLTQLITKTKVQQTILSTGYSDVGNIITSTMTFINNSFVPSKNDLSTSYSRDYLQTLNPESLVSFSSFPYTLAATGFTTTGMSTPIPFATYTKLSKHTNLLTNFQTEPTTLLDISGEHQLSPPSSSFITPGRNASISYPKLSMKPSSEELLRSSSMRDGATSSKSFYLLSSLSSYFPPDSSSYKYGSTPLPTTSYLSPSYTISSSSSWTPTPSLQSPTPRVTSSNGRFAEQPNASPNVYQTNTTTVTRATDQALSQKNLTHTAPSRTLKINESDNYSLHTTSHTNVLLNVSVLNTEDGGIKGVTSSYVAAIEAETNIALTQATTLNKPGTSVYPHRIQSLPYELTSLSEFTSRTRHINEISYLSLITSTATTALTVSTSTGYTTDMTNAITQTERIVQDVSRTRFGNTILFTDIGNRRSVPSASHTESVNDASLHSLNNSHSDPSKTPKGIHATITATATDSGSLMTIAPSITLGLVDASDPSHDSANPENTENKGLMEYTYAGVTILPATSLIRPSSHGLHSSVYQIYTSTNSIAFRYEQSLTSTRRPSTSTSEHIEPNTVSGIISTVPIATRVSASSTSILTTKMAPTIKLTSTTTATVQCKPNGPGVALVPSCTTTVTQETPTEESFNDTDGLDEVCMAEIYAGQRWKQTRVGHTAVTQCLDNPYEIIARLCLSFRVWAEPDTQACSIPSIGQQLDNLILISYQPSIEPRDLPRLAYRLSRSADDLTSHDDVIPGNDLLSAYVEAMQILSDLPSRVDQCVMEYQLEYGNLFLQAVNALLRVENVEKWSQIPGAGEEGIKLIEAVETFAARTSGNECHLSLNPTGNMKTFEGVYKNIVFRKMQFQTDLYEGSTYTGGDAEIVVNSDFYTLNDKLNDTVTLVVAFYPTIADLMKEIRTSADQSISQVYSTIVTASTIHQTISDHTNQFKAPFCMSFTSGLKDQNSSGQCAFIARSISGESEWSTDGCWLEAKNNHSITCCCNHMTTFALLEIEQDTPSASIDVIHVVLSGVACFILIVDILLHFVLRYIDRGIICAHVSQDIASIIAFSSIILSSIQIFTGVTCKVMSGLMYYGIICQFLKNVECAVYLCVLSTRGGQNAVRYWLWQIIGWISPLLPIGISLAFWIEDFGGENGNCWLRGNAQISAIVSTALIAMTNICLLIGLHPHVRRSRRTFPRGRFRRKPQTKGIRSEIHCNIVCLVVLVLCWICGLLFLATATSYILRYIYCALAITQSLGFVAAHNFICSQMKTALKHASRNSWRDHIITSSVPTSTSVSQIRAHRDVGVGHHGNENRRKRVSKGEDALSRIKSEVTTSASSAFRWRIEHWRRRTNQSSTDQSRRTMSTSIGTDSRRHGSCFAQQRDRRDTLCIPIEEHDLDLELTRSLSKSTSRSDHMGYPMGSVRGTERSYRTGNIVLEHMRLEPIKQVSLVGNQALIEQHHRRSLDYQRSSRKMSSSERSSIRPSLYDCTMDNWPQMGRCDGNNIKSRKLLSVDLISERNAAGPSSSQKRRYQKKIGRSRARPHSLSFEREASIKDGSAKQGTSRQYHTTKIFEQSPDHEQESNRTYHHPGDKRHIDFTGDKPGAPSSTIYGQRVCPDPQTDQQETSQTCHKAEKAHIHPPRNRKTEQNSSVLGEERRYSLYESNARHLYDDELPGSEHRLRDEISSVGDERKTNARHLYDDELPGSEHRLRDEISSVGDERKTKKRSRRRRKRKSRQSRDNN